MHSLPPQQVTRIVNCATGTDAAATQATPPHVTTPPHVAVAGTATGAPVLDEVAAVEAAVTAHRNTHPQNMFASFSLAVHHDAGALGTTSAPMLHWGHVDTGAMVNLVYSGVLEVFEQLHRYRQEFQHTVSGVGQSRTRVVGKLVGVPLHVGPA